MVTREEIKARMHDENIRYVLTQFVDLNGSPKAKMVPADHLDDVLDVGAGFAGAALGGMGQGPHSHDMLARIARLLPIRSRVSNSIFWRMLFEGAFCLAQSNSSSSVEAAGRVPHSSRGSTEKQIERVRGIG